MKSVVFTLFLLSVVYLWAIAEAIKNPTRFRRSYNELEILKSNMNDFGAEVGIPLVFHGDTKPIIRTGIAKIPEKPEDVANESAEEAISDEDSELENDIESEKNAEETGSGYDNIDGMGPEQDDEEHLGSEGSGESSGIPDLSGEFPPDADEISKLPKDIEFTPEEVDRKMADKRKGYIQFALRQPFKPDFKYKESSAYKILSGNVIQDVEKALKSRGIIKDVLFREAKNVGGPPYRSKVEVYLKLQKDVNPKKLKKIVDRGLINGMVSIPGSFHAT